jgi:hypothetical protein
MDVKKSTEPIGPSFMNELDTLGLVAQYLPTQQDWPSPITGSSPFGS